MIAAVQFDILWVQYYNTPICSARSWITNPSSSGFSYDTWAAFLLNTASAKAKLYIGLHGSPSAAANPTFYLSPVEAEKIIQTFFCRKNFGGIMLWDATYAEGNINQGMTYYQTMKEILARALQNTSQPCVQTVPVQSSAKISVSSTTSSTRTASSTTAIHPTEASILTTTRKSPFNEFWTGCNDAEFAALYGECPRRY
jgi:chitinase